ncbi:uncharacterized protein LOC128231753 isoform X2 [Mya arenaria]|uniref:uncharacterized protein LOC128231753 isoform X2 n=1 Tax=Mya arenaria TaxID=6604 RepID=UPI0022E0F710|nr:uncharacterized protein LOC128231753 isoform X2 [Mya arenaria]
MRLQYLMAAVRKGPSGALERVPSAGSRQKFTGKTGVRSVHPNSSPLFKTQSESALSDRLQKLSLKDGQNNGTQRRLLSGWAGANGTVRSLADAAKLLQSESVKNIVVVAGAGISTPSGIPDFRTPGTGLYDNLQQYKIPYPEAIFDIDYFHVNPRPFFTLAKELYPSGKYRPNYIHYFLRLLHDKGMLLRMYTQNIDGLERLAGIPEDKMVEAHGTFATATCTMCKQKLPGSDIKEKIFTDKLPRCPTRGCVGIVKPDIVFFGEDLPRRFYSYMKDMLQTDLVLVMGTSLEVQPFAGIIDTVRQNIPRVLFNREAVGPFRFNRRAQDIVAAGDLVDGMVKFASQVGWSEDMKQLITQMEGSFTIARVKTYLKLNKQPPPPPQTNHRRNFSTQAYKGRPKFSIYNEESSSEESSESESDVTSSDSSEEDGKRRRVFKGGHHGRNIPQTVNNRRNGAISTNNGVRSTSAKVTESGRRNVYTQRTVKPTQSPVGNLSGRSVKSESAINSNLTKVKVEVRRPPLPKDMRSVIKPEAREAFVEDKAQVNKFGKETNGSKSEVDKDKSTTKTDDSKVETVLDKNSKTDGSHKTGNREIYVEKEIADSLVQDITKTKYDKDGSRSSLDIDITDKKIEKVIPKPSSDHSVRTRYATSKVLRGRQALQEKTKQENQSIDEVQSNGNKVDSQTSASSERKHSEKEVSETESVNRQDDVISLKKQVSFKQETFATPKEAFEAIVSEISERTNIDVGEIADLTKSDRKKILKKYGIKSLPPPQTPNKPPLGVQRNRHVDSPMKLIKLVQSESAVASGYFVDDNNMSGIAKTNQADIPAVSRIERERPLSVTEPKLNRDKMDEKRTQIKPWHEGTVSTNQMSPIFNDVKPIPSSTTLPSGASSICSMNSNDTGSKILSEKTAKSFAKYASLTSGPSHKKKKRHGSKKHRITLKDRPSPGHKHTSKRSELKTVNAVPYGYAHKKNSKVKGVGPFHRTNVRTLNRDIDYADIQFRSVSADIPKISYQHRMKQSPSGNGVAPEDMSGFSTPVNENRDGS